MCSNTTETRKVVYSVEVKFCFEQVYWVEAQRGNSTCVGDSGKGVKALNCTLKTDFRSKKHLAVCFKKMFANSWILAHLVYQPKSLIQS